MLEVCRQRIRILIYFHHVVSFLVWMEAPLIGKCPWFLGYRCDQPWHELPKIVHLARKNLAGNHKGDVARLEAMLRNRCLRVNREGHEDQSTQRDQQFLVHSIASTKVEPLFKKPS